MGESRTKNSIRNSAVALIEHAVYTIMSFACRTVFIMTLGKTYLGFSGLFSDILSLLSLTEMGVGTAIVYSMYKPVAEKNYVKIAALLNLYKKFYHLIGLFIAVVGACLAPFLDFFISDIPDMPEIPLIYLLYLLNTVLSYFFIYKKSILITEQKSYISSFIFIITTIFQNGLQMIFLLLTNNFIIYLIIQAIANLCNNVAVSMYVDKHYKYLREYKSAQLNAEEKKTIFENVKSMFINKVSSAVVTSTDNILISKFVSTVVLGFYSNYTLFTNLFRTILSKVFEALTGSVGNLVAVESSQRIYDSFRKIWFVNFWLASFSCVALLTLINPFISLWVGDDYLLDMQVVVMICLNLYMRLIRNTFITFNDTCGIFKQMRIKSLAEAIINLIVSVLFVGPFKMGIFGVLLGTFISNLCTNFWYEPYLLFRNIFKKPYRIYFTLFFEYLLLSVISAIFTTWIFFSAICVDGWPGFFIKLVVTCCLINLFYIIIFRNTKEFEYLVGIIKNRFKK